MCVVFSFAGVTPFQGRGKSDVDWLILEAKQRPGPGYYEFNSPLRSGGRFSTAKLKSDLDVRLETKKDIPGPGAYELGTGLKKQVTLTAIARKNQIGDQIESGNYDELFQSYK